VRRGRAGADGKVVGVRRWLSRALLLVLLGVLAWWLRSTFFVAEPLAVRVVEVDRGTVEETVTNSRAGTVDAHRRARLSPETGGNAVAIPYREGDAVEAGAVLLQLDPSLLRAHLELALRDADAARSRREQACLEADRAERERIRISSLAAEKIVSTDRLDATESRAESARVACGTATADAERAASAVALARVELERLTIRAPFAGVIADISIELGEWTTPSPPALPVPPVIDLLDRDSIYVRAPMDEVDSARLHPGQRARVTIDSHRGESFDGTVGRIAVFVLDLEAQNRTVDVEVELTDRALAASLKTGTSADVEVILDVRENVLRVPTGSLFDGNHVLALGDDGVLEERELVLGLRNWNFTEVASGVAAGERIVASLDRPEIRAGARVVVAAEGAPPKP